MQSDFQDVERDSIHFVEADKTCQAIKGEVIQYYGTDESLKLKSCALKGHQLNNSC